MKTYHREALERGVIDILLGTRDGGGAMFLPRVPLEPICLHNVTREQWVDGAVSSCRSDVGYSPDLRVLLDHPRHLEEVDAAWFRPFVEHLLHGRDFSLDDVERAHRAHRGGALWINVVHA